MYCIIGYEFEKKYLAFQDTGDEIQYGYYLTDKETFMSNLSNNKKNHPTLFKTVDKAMEFIRWLYSVRNGFMEQKLFYEWIESSNLPKCDMDCFKCNKKHKYQCRYLRNPYQNHCGFIMAKFGEEFKPDEKRLDAPCEKCLTKGCIYNMNCR